MAQKSTIGIGVALALVAGIAATSAALWFGHDQQSLPTGDLLRIEPSIDATLTPVHAALAWSAGIASGDRLLTDTDFVERLSPSFRREDTPAGIRAEFERMQEMLGGPVNFVRILEISNESGSSVGVAGNGIPVVTEVGVDEEGQIDQWLLTDSLSGSRVPPWQIGMILAGGFAFLGAALLARRSHRKPAETILVSGAIVVFLQVAVLSDAPGLYLLGRAAPLIAVPFAVWVLIDTYPLPGSPVLVATASLAASVGLVAVFLVDPSRVGHPVLPTIIDSSDAARFATAAAAVIVAVTMGVVVALVLRRREDWRQARDPSPWMVMAGAALWSLTGLLGHFDLTVGGGALQSAVIPGATLLALLLVPGASALASMYGMWDRAELADLVVDLERGHVNMQAALSNALDDDSLHLLRWSDELGGLVDESGHPASDVNGDDRRRTHIVSSGRIVGALDHRASLLRRPERLRAVAAAAGMALQVDRLNAQVEAQLAEVQASRARIVAAADRARRHVERDLHDGAQQRLVALGLMLQRGRRLAEGRVCDEVSALLDLASAEVRHVLTELRDVSRGVHPPLLSERGLAAAIEGLTEHLPIDVSADVVESRLPAETELASYYVVAESLTNVVKHSGAEQADVTISLLPEGELRIVVADRGRGGASSTRGSGLQGLADRLDAIGGALHLNSPVDGGTVVEAVIPCG